MEEKTAEGGAGEHGCFFCTMLPLIEHRWNEATRGHFKNSRVEFLKGDARPDRRPYRASFEGRRTEGDARYGRVTPSSRSSAAGW